MSEFQKQLVVLVLDKGLLALVIGVFGLAAKRYLDRLNARATYKHRLAEERIRAYKEISRIVCSQVQILGIIPQILLRPNDTEAAKDKMRADFTKYWNQLTESYRTETPKLLAEIIFISSDVADLLIAYGEAFNGFMSIPRCGARGEELPLPPSGGILKIASELQIVLSKEIHNFHVTE